MKWTETSVLFYGESDPLDNFYPARFKLDKKWWPTSEHYYQAQKSTNPEDIEKVRKAKTPGESKRLGRALKMRKDWEGVKYEVMLKALRAKFSQNPELGELLKSTAGFKLCENSPTDWEWGIGSDGKGQNRLGKALMQVRKELYGC